MCVYKKQAGVVMTFIAACGCLCVRVYVCVCVCVYVCVNPFLDIQSRSSLNPFFIQVCI